MKRSLISGLVCVVFAGISTATTITYNFGTGAGITSAPSPLGTVSGTYGGGATNLGVTSFQLSSGVTISGSADLTCIAGTGPTGCFGASGNVTTGNSAGLGVLGGGGDNRLDGTETLTITIAPGFNVTLDGLSLAGFSGNELFSYQINGGTQTQVSPNGDVALDSYTINSAVTSGSGGTIEFRTPDQLSGSPSTVNLYSLTLDVTPVTAPEPATLGMVGLSLLGLGAARRRFRR